LLRCFPAVTFIAVSKKLAWLEGLKPSPEAEEYAGNNKHAGLGSRTHPSGLMNVGALCSVNLTDQVV
jgi:hypothetical protein